MKLTLHSASAAAGLSLLCCLGWAGPLLSPYHDWIYHDDGRASSVFFPVLASMFLLWLMFWLLLRIGAGSVRGRRLVWSGVICFVPWLLVEDFALLMNWRLVGWESVGLLLVSGVAWVVLIAARQRLSTPLLRRTEHFFRQMLAFGGVCAVIVAGQMGWFLREASSLQTVRPLHVSTVIETVGGPYRPRIIWVILDELSYRQVYDHRFPGLQLPAFDRLASEATVFTNVEPTALSTEEAVPSMMSGLPLDQARAHADGTLDRMHDPQTGRWHRLDVWDTVFGDALKHGYRTAVADGTTHIAA